MRSFICTKKAPNIWSALTTTAQNAESPNSKAAVIILSVKKCGLYATYGSDLKFKSDSPDFPFKTTKEWYKAQSDYINSIDPTEMVKEMICTDEIDLFEVIPYKKKIKYGKYSVSLYGDRIILN